jgi:hypothetical protein
VFFVSQLSITHDTVLPVEKSCQHQFTLRNVRYSKSYPFTRGSRLCLGVVQFSEGSVERLGSQLVKGRHPP